MDAGDALNHILSDRVRPWARQHGFTKHGMNFTNWVGTNCKVISFQKLNGSVLAGSGFHLRFRLIAAVFYTFLHEFESPHLPLPKHVSLYHCQWWQRIGFSEEKGLIKPWVVYGREPEADNKTAKEIMIVLEDNALPLLHKYSGEGSDLAEVWGTDEPCRTNRFFGNGQRLRYLAIHLVKNCRLAELDKVVAEISAVYDSFGRRETSDFGKQFINKIIEKRQNCKETVHTRNMNLSNNNSGTLL